MIRGANPPCETFKDPPDLRETPSTAKPVPTPCSPRPPRETFLRSPQICARDTSTAKLVHHEDISKLTQILKILESIFEFYFFRFYRFAWDHTPNHAFFLTNQNHKLADENPPKSTHFFKNLDFVEKKPWLFSTRRLKIFTKSWLFSPRICAFFA